VEGNPVGFRDPSGNSTFGGLFGNLGKKFLDISWQTFSKSIGNIISKSIRFNKGMIDKALDRLENNIKNYPHNVERMGFARSSRFDIKSSRFNSRFYTRDQLDSALAVGSSIVVKHPLALALTNKNIRKQVGEFIQNPKYAIEHSDLARSDFGREVTQAWRYLSQDVNWSKVIGGVYGVFVGACITFTFPGFGVSIMGSGLGLISEGLTGKEPEGTPGQNSQGEGILIYPR
jgi:hypothetical protein